MKIISKTFKILPLLLFVFAFQGCSDDDNETITIPQSLNIVETAQATPALATLVDAVLAADGDLATVLSGNGPFTVLAPTNDAFQDLLDTNAMWNTVNDIPSDVLEQVLRNHVIPAELTAADLVAESGPDGKGYTRTLAAGVGGENLSLLFDTSGALPVFNNTATVAGADLADVEASNGIVHVIDAVLGLPTIVDHAVNNDNFSVLTSALVANDLDDTLVMDGPFTVFAPTNDAFNNFANPNNNEISDILSNHVIIGTAAFADGLSSGYQNTAALYNGEMGQNLSMYVDVAGDGTVTLNGMSMVVLTDVVGTNGVIHVVDTVIDLPTIVTHAVANPNFTTLVAALTDLTPTDYVTALSSSDADNDASPFTVFAPLNTAFDDLLTDLQLDNASQIPTATLEATLNLHVITDINVRESGLPGLNGTSVVTFGGGSITIDANTPAIVDPDGGSNPIVLTDVQAANGVIHAISRVIRDL